ncbi:MAG: hypothetical protein SFW64_02705 [Alphaproteobacteria bacterium]|nr:hypothetical protein [Alphaproteobacteria bacterium]
MASVDWTGIGEGSQSESPWGGPRGINRDAPNSPARAGTYARRAKGGYSRNNVTHSGEVTVSGASIHWERSGSGEILFARGSGEPASFSALNLSANDELALVNYLLAHYRPSALPDAQGYYAASAGITVGGQLFVGVNNEQAIKDPFAGRGCAETSVLQQMQQATGDKDVQIAKSYLMAGKAVRRQDGTLQEEAPGHLSCPCGECRQNYRAHSKDATFFIIPTNDGTADLTINQTAKSSSELQENEVWAIGHNTLYPWPEYKHLAIDNNAVVRDGYLYITNTKTPAVPLETGLPEISAEDRQRGFIAIAPAQYERLKNAYVKPDLALPALKDNPGLENINRAMLGLIKEAYAAHTNRKNLEVTVMLVQNKQGDFYASVNIKGEGLPAKAPPAQAALANGLNQIGIRAAYMMTFNEAQILGEINAANGASAEGHRLKMPNPADLGRLIKNMNGDDDVKLTVIPINNGRLTEAKLEEISDPIPLRTAFSPAFTSPKQMNSHDCASHGGCGGGWGR